VPFGAAWLASPLHLRNCVISMHPRSSPFLAAIALAVVLFGGLAARAAPKPPKPKDSSDGRPCFNLAVKANSKGTTAVFKQRHLQGGGESWAAILESLVKGYTKFVRESHDYAPGMPHFGIPNIVTYRDVETWYILDDEGDVAVFCAGDPELLKAARADYDRLNSDGKALEEALDHLGPGHE
jgi:hypothetical protein